MASAPIELSDEVLERLGTDLIVWLTTVSSDGQPQSSPVWFLWEDGTFLIYSQPHATKVRNLRSSPRVALTLGTDETASSYVTFEGTATVPDGPSGSDVPAYLEKYEALIAGEGWTVEWMTGEYSQPVRITPTRVRVA
jgi:PPOX class probable F420-dependent enzyme